MEQSESWIVQGARQEKTVLRGQQVQVLRPKTVLLRLALRVEQAAANEWRPKEWTSLGAQRLLRLWRETQRWAEVDAVRLRLELYQGSTSSGQTTVRTSASCVLSLGSTRCH